MSDYPKFPHAALDRWLTTPPEDYEDEFEEESDEEPICNTCHVSRQPGGPPYSLIGSRWICEPCYEEMCARVPADAPDVPHYGVEVLPVGFCDVCGHSHPSWTSVSTGGLYTMVYDCEVCGCTAARFMESKK